ncbi:MAG: PhzF family phenazine biosynthesis isomerase [Planctomycetes bacterium]|jgi:predicted PhzF superfamily epimerase YddE/YHI9|nr:PhzF family phenazine biosynthesis isomerase [Planctomycetota bacterium]
MTPLPLYQIDAFTDRPFTGNPAAVVLCDAPLAAETMQAVGAEMNLSETAFVLPPDPAGVRPIRYFTPTIEVELCGHATLASAHALWERGDASGDQPITFRNTTDAELTCTRDEAGRIAMVLPRDQPREADPPPGLLDAWGVTASATARGKFDWLIELADADAVRIAAPRFEALKQLERGVLLTAPGDEPGLDFVSRFFAPAAGIDEDPVTGSAHCLLGPYWAGKLGKTALHARQVSRRGGELWVELDSERDTVTVAGHAVTMVRGELSVD